MLPVAPRPAVYAAALGALAADSTDLCVQLTAVETLRQLVADWDFDEEQFAPHVAPLLARLPALLAACAALESQVRSCVCAWVVPR